MKRRIIGLLFVALAVSAQAPKRTELTDAERLELFNARGEMDKVIIELQKQQSKLKALQQVHEGRIKILAKEHNAENCNLDSTLMWTDCKSVVERK